MKYTLIADKKLVSQKLLGLFSIFLMIGWIYADVAAHPLKPVSDPTPSHQSADISQSQTPLFSDTSSTESFQNETQAIKERITTPKEPKLTEKHPQIAPQLLLNSSLQVDEIQSDNLSFLQKVYAQTKDPEILTTIIQVYLDAYQFVAAAKYLENLPLAEQQQVRGDLRLQVMFNSFSLADEKVITTLWQKISRMEIELSHETFLRYQSLLLLMQKDYDHFFEISQQYQNLAHKNFAQKIQQIIQNVQSQKDMPEYYRDGLVAVELFKQGYFQPAKVLALDVMGQDGQYILPYQVLAYANFLTTARSSAVTYLEILLKMDPSQAESYTLLLGIAEYRNQNYERSVLHLSQVQNTIFATDKERYLALDYQALQQPQKLLSSREKLLGFENTLEPSDFYHYFYQVFFKPYQEGEDFELYHKDKALAKKYLALCQRLFVDEDQLICKYGETGILIAEGEKAPFEQQEKKKKNLILLTEKYPQGYLFHALGEIYLEDDQILLAEKSLLKALGMSTSSKEKKTIRHRLEELVQ